MPPQTDAANLPTPEPNLPVPQQPSDEKPSRKKVYTDVLGNELEGDDLERAKDVSLVGRPYSPGDPANQKDDEKPS